MARFSNSLICNRFSSNAPVHTMGWQKNYPDCVSPYLAQQQMQQNYTGTGAPTTCLVTNRTQESLEGIRGDQTEFVLEDMHQSRENLLLLQNQNRNGEFICAPKIDERSEEQESMSMTMQEEAISILTAEQAKRERTEISTQVLSVGDHLTCSDAIDFWHRYFSDHAHNDVHVDTFHEAVQAEFSSNIFRTAFDEDLPADQAAVVNEEDAMGDFYACLQNKVSIDQEFVSLNALELFTRKAGLSKSIKALLEECIQRNRAQQSIKLNDTIVQELAEVKKMLDQKNKQLATREADLKRREQALAREKLEAARDLEAMYTKKLADTEKRFAKETQAFQKKLNQAERNMTNKVRLIQQAKSQPGASLQASSTLKQSKGRDIDQSKQLKARVQNLEKSYEVLKNRNKESEAEKVRLGQENTKLAEELAKMKSAKSRLNKEMQDLKASHATALDSAAKNAMVVDELEKSQSTATTTIQTSTANSQSSAQKQAGAAKMSDDSATTSSAVQSLKLSSNILITLNQTFPLMFQQAVQANMPEDELDNTELVAVCSPTPQIGEMLFPGFNLILPQFAEHVLPNLTALSAKEASIMLQLFFQLLDFAFRTQIFRQTQQAVAQASSIVMQQSNGSSLQNLLSSKQAPLDFGSQAQHRPMHLEFVPRSKQFIARKNKVATQSHGRGKQSNKLELLPFYPVFRDQAAQQVVVNDLKLLSKPPQHQPEKSTLMLKKMNTAPQQAALQLSTKDKVVVSLLKIELTSDYSDLVESLHELKHLLGASLTEEVAQETLLSDESAAMQLLCLTLLLPIPDVAAVTITIFLALSFSQKYGDLFTAQLMQEETFQVFQQAMLAEVASFQSKGVDMTQSEVAGAASALEDYVVILQKATTRDPASIISLIDSRLVERLHGVIDQIVRVSAEKESSSAAGNSNEQTFLVQNIKSILRNISVQKNE